MSSSDTYFVAATTVTPGPTSARTSSYRALICSGDVGDHPLPAGPPCVTAVREEQIRVAGRAQVRASHVRDSCGAQGALGGGPEVEPPVPHHLVTVTLAERRGDLLPDLVAARTDPGADRRRERASSERCDSASDDPAQQAAPADVQRRDRGRPAVGAGNRDRQAVGGEDEQRLSGRVGPEPVTRLPRPGRPRDGGSVHLPVVAEKLRVGPELRAEPAAVLRHMLGSVVCEAAAVE